MPDVVTLRLGLLAILIEPRYVWLIPQEVAYLVASLVSKKAKQTSINEDAPFSLGFSPRDNPDAQAK